MRALRFLATLIICLSFAYPARAAQDTTVMPTSGPHSMADFVENYLNPAFAAFGTCNSGTSAPANGTGSVPLEFWCWADKTDNQFKYYVGGTFVPWASFDTGANTITVLLSAGGTGAGTASAARDNLGLTIGSIIQAWDADLDAISALTSTGFAARTGSNTWAQRSLVAPAAGFTITNPAGIAGNPTFVLSDDLAALEAMSGTGIVARTAANTYAQRTLTPPAAGIGVTNGDGVLGNPTLSLTNDLAALEALSSTGYAVRTGSDAWAQRTFQAGTGMSVTNGDGVSGNTTYAISDAELLAFADLTSAADKCIYFSGSGTAATFDCKSWARTFIGAADASAGRTAIGLTIGTDVQTQDADLQALADNSTVGIWARTGPGTGAARSIVGTTNEIVVSNGDGGLGNPTLGLASALNFTGKTITGGTIDDAMIGGTTPAAATATVLTATQKLRLNNAVTATQITADEDDYDGTDGSNTCATKKTIRLSSDAARSITGLSCSQVDGDIVVLYNAGSFAITLADESADSIAANRFGFGANLELASKQGATLIYDGDASRWRQIGGPSASGGGSGTVTQVNTGAGLKGGPITTSGDVEFDDMAGRTIKGNAGTSSAYPADVPVADMVGWTYTRFTASNGAWPVPAGTSEILIKVWGAGGSGAGGNTATSARGAGGGGGGCIVGFYRGTMDATLAITIGSGGAAVASASGGAAGNSGGTTSVVGTNLGTIQSTGGVGGGNGAAAGGAGGTPSASGAIASNIIQSVAGQDGMVGRIGSNTSVASGGSAPCGGGPGGQANVGVAGVAPGGGGANGNHTGGSNSGEGAGGGVLIMTR